LALNQNKVLNKHTDKQTKEGM